VTGIVGLAKAVEIAFDTMEERTREEAKFGITP
jgi:cysteine sulfinate desulfinase/cysteine desulfurase-like protein